MYMKRLFTSALGFWVCFSLIVYPTLSYAQDQPVPLQAGEAAPFNGVLLPTVKAAEMTAALEQQENQCDLRIQTEVQQKLSKSQLLLDNCTSARETYEEMYKAQLVSQKEYIDFLEKRATSPRISQEVVFIIGIVAGVGITIGAGYAMNQAAH